MPELICLGELLIDFCSTAVDVPVGEAPGFTKAPGGAPANVAVAAQRLGAQAGFVGAVGDDPFGAFLAGALAGEGVETTGLAKLPGVKTPLAFVAVRSDGAGDFFFYHDAGLAPLTQDLIDESYVASAAALHFGSISRIDPAARAATDKARAAAAEKGLLVSYDPNYRPRLWGGAQDARDRIREGFSGATVVKISQEEWEFAVGSKDFHQGARQLLDAGIEVVIRSEGGDGASFATNSTRGHVEALAVEPVEFTGAGDAFVGSLLVDLLAVRAGGGAPADLDEAALRRIVGRANAAGALATTRPGAIPALPRREELEAFLKSRPAR